MLKSGSFWKTFFTVYLAIVAGIWGFLEAYTYFEGDSLRELLGPYWLAIYGLPLFFAFTIAALRTNTPDSPAETLDQRNRRVMFNHVENFWVKGVLEKSLHGAALLRAGDQRRPERCQLPVGDQTRSDRRNPAGRQTHARYFQ